MTEHAGQQEERSQLPKERQGKLLPDLSLQGRVGLLRDLPPQKRLALILEDPDPAGLVAVLEPQEYHLLLREIGLDDSYALLPLATPEQLTFCLDRELWRHDEYLPQRGMQWLTLLMAAEEEDDLVSLLPHLDFALLLLIIMQEITVGGGIGDLTTDDERQTEWDHSFDNIFMITYRHDHTSDLVGRFLDLVFRSDKDLYLAIMQGVKNEVSSEVEEHCRRYRSGRLADFGFPERLDALTESFSSEGSKKFFSADRDPVLPSLFRHDDSLLGRTLRRADSPDLLRELQYLITCALVVEDPDSEDDERAEAILLRVHGYLTIALEYLGGDDETRALESVANNYLKQLFQLGYSLVRRLRRQAAPFTSDDHATSSVLAGLRYDFPQFYRGLGSEGIDGYREFSDLEDVRTVEKFLELLAG
jgi:Family of unknown function (DUF6178)